MYSLKIVDNYKSISKNDFYALIIGDIIMNNNFGAMDIKISIYNFNNIEIKTVEGRYYLPFENFFDEIEVQKNQGKSVNSYPYIYNTKAFKEFQSKYPELSVLYGLY